MSEKQSQGNVIGLSRRRAGAAADPFVEFESYWHALCAGRIMPYRDEIDPRGMGGALPRIFLLERIAPGAARFRVAGQHLSEFMGMDLRGMPLSCVFTAESRSRLAGALQALFDEPARIELTLEGVRSVLSARSAARLVCLPLRHRTGSVERAIGCLDAGELDGRTAHRLDIVTEMRRTLIGYGNVPQPAATSPSEVVAGSPPKTRGTHLKVVASS